MQRGIWPGPEDDDPWTGKLFCDTRRLEVSVTSQDVQHHGRDYGTHRVGIDDRFCKRRVASSSSPRRIARMTMKRCKIELATPEPIAQLAEPHCTGAAPRPLKPAPAPPRRASNSEPLTDGQNGDNGSGRDPRTGRFPRGNSFLRGPTVVLSLRDCAVCPVVYGTLPATRMPRVPLRSSAIRKSEWQPAPLSSLEPRNTTSPEPVENSSSIHSGMLPH